MDISVIIVSWNVRDLLKKCLESVFRFTKNSVILSEAKNPRDNPRDPSATPQDDVSFEVIVVDNASTDGTVEMVKRDFPQVKLIADQENRGFAAANNQGIKEANGEYILLLNPDTELIEDSLSGVVKKMRSDSSIGVLGCKLLNSDKTFQPSVRRFPRVRDIAVMLFKLHKLFPSLLDRYLMKDFTELTPHPNPLPKGEGTTHEVDQVMGAFFCIRKSLLDKIGLLDEGYFIWFEEVDFCRRAKKAGYKVVYWPDTSVVHHGGQSFSQQTTLKKQWWFFKSALRYFLKRG